MYVNSIYMFGFMVRRMISKLTVANFLALCTLGLTLQTPSPAFAVEKITLWPTVFFLRGQDLCQYQDAFGSSRNELVSQSMGHMKDLLMLGVTAVDAVYTLQKLDELIDKNKQMAIEGNGMDIMLEATLKASINSVTRNFNPQNTRLQFANPGSTLELIRGLKNNKRFESEDTVLLSKVKGFVWGTYSYSPGCKGDLLVTLHVVLPKGESVSFKDQGKPENVMGKLALQMVRHFQKTGFPTLVMMGDKMLVLVGAPGFSINQAPNSEIASTACKMVNARLPSEDEYEYLSILGDWNGGVSLGHVFWALSNKRIFSPDTRNPSPVRTHAEIHYAEVNFYCVK
jgi:hypothetical protein